MNYELGELHSATCFYIFIDICLHHISNSSSITPHLSFITHNVGTIFCFSPAAAPPGNSDIPMCYRHYLPGCGLCLCVGARRYAICQPDDPGAERPSAGVPKAILTGSKSHRAPTAGPDRILVVRLPLCIPARTHKWLLVFRRPAFCRTLYRRTDGGYTGVRPFNARVTGCPATA